MSAMEDRVKNLEDGLRKSQESIRSLETKFSVAATVALFLGVSVAGLGGWVKYEASEVSDPHDDIKKLDPFVKDATAQLQKTGKEQLALIQNQADPIVKQLAQDNFYRLNGKISADLNSMRNGSTQEIYSSNPAGDKLPNDKGDKNLDCPTGELVKRVGVHWIGNNVSYIAVVCESPLK